jgi:hypothetical protein
MVLKMVQEQQVERKSWEQYLSEGMEAREMGDDSAWKLGDLALGIDKDYGEDSLGKYAYAIGVVKKTLQGYRTVAATFSPKTREKYHKLSFSHFKTLAALPKPNAWLEKADDNDWSVETLTKEVQEEYGAVKAPNLDDEVPKAYRCPECGLWRLEGVSAYDICKGHYVFEKGKLEYK